MSPVAKKSSKKTHGKTKKVPIGWKKEGANFTYYLKGTVAKRFSIKKIEFLGYKARPVGLSLYNTGGGFNRRQSNKIGGDYFLAFFKDKYKRELKLSIFSNGNGSTTFKVQKRSVTVSILFENFIEILKDLGDEIKQNRESVIAKRLAGYFPQEFRDTRNPEQSADSKLSEINLSDLKDTDHEAVGKFIKKYISLNADNDEVLEKLQTDLVIQGRKKTLDQVIKKFEKHLKDPSFDEKKWQKFLHEEVFFFLSNYIESIREANVNFGKTDEGEKKPDFVWIDIYGFLDVFEIKTPQADILAKRIDKSHDNYYFSSDAARAIAQIEKYVLFLEKNVENFEKYISKKTKLPFSVLKPKAFLIIGSSKELENNPEKKKDFRLLRRLFKNIEFITFDELLDNLKNLASKFDKEIK
jgi:hypothetical protein